MKRILIVPFVLLFLTCAAMANPACTAVGLDQYIANNGTLASACQIGDKLFYGFGYQGTFDSGPAPDASFITITPDTLNPILNPGLIISSGIFNVFPGDSLDVFVTYSVATVSGSALMEDYSLTITGQHTPGLTGYGIVTESFSNSAPGLPLVTNFGPAADNPFAHVAFTPFIAGTTVQTRIQANAIGDDFVTISGIQENFSEQIPEPYAAVLIGSGLVLLGMRRKRAA